MLGLYTLADGPMMPKPPDPRLKRWRKRAVRTATIVLLLMILLVSHRPLLVGFAHLFRVNDAAPGDAVVVLLGGPSHRPRQAAMLYGRHLAPRILVGETTVSPELGFSETDLTRRILTKDGVPAEAIEVLPGVVTSTRDEAIRVRDYIRTHPKIRRITVVTSAFHTARARWIFRKVLRGLNVDIRMAAADQPEFDENDWYTKDEGLVMYFSEAIKSLFYRLAY